jgi:hypothetical protein
LKIITVGAAAALAVWPLSLTPAALSQVETAAPTGAPNSAGKADRLDMGPRGAACWRTAGGPYDSACLYDGMRPGGEVRKVRVFAADRISIAD